MRIDNDKPDYELLSKLNDNEITANGKKFMKEHEEHIRCFEALNEEVERTGYMYGRNIFKK